jgi:DNA-binding NarL/FixJ family response regulator
LTYRVLVVDDYERWRRHLSSTLQKSGRWRIVGEVGDGLQAVQQARALRPDLILLDIGLPVLDGIQATQRILALDPGARILFLSEHRSWDIAKAALETGARGYLVKSEAAAHLLPAMDAIIEGRRFISPALAAHAAIETKQERPRPETRRHDAAFYSDERSLLKGYAQFAEATLRAGGSFIVVSGPGRREKVREELHARGIDVDRATEDGRYRPLDVAEVLSQFMLDGRIDGARFWTAARALVADAARLATGEQPHVSACGDAAPTLWKDGYGDAAVQLEHLWDELATECHVEILCGYAGHGAHDTDNHMFDRICAEHSAVHLL